MTEPPPSKAELRTRLSSWEAAGLPAPPYAREGQDPLLPRHWLRAVREARGLTQHAVAQGVTASVPEAPLTLSRLAHLGGGRLSLLSVRGGQMEGLRRVLDVPVSVWHRVFSEGRG